MDNNTTNNTTANAPSGTSVWALQDEPNTNMTPSAITFEDFELTDYTGEKRTCRRQTMTFSIYLNRETREIKFTGLVGDDRADNGDDFVCRIGFGEKAHSCYVFVWQQKDGTWKLGMNTTALNRQARVTAFKGQVRTEVVKSQHVGSKVD